MHTKSLQEHARNTIPSVAGSGSGALQRPEPLQERCWVRIRSVAAPGSVTGALPSVAASGTAKGALQGQNQERCSARELCRSFTGAGSGELQRLGALQGSLRGTGLGDEVANCEAQIAIFETVPTPS